MLDLSKSLCAWLFRVVEDSPPLLTALILEGLKERPEWSPRIFTNPKLPVPGNSPTEPKSKKSKNDKKNQTLLSSWFSTFKAKEPLSEKIADMSELVVRRDLCFIFICNCYT